MTIAKIFFAYMALVGVAAGAILVAAPRVMDFWIKPYFWVLIAVALFDGVAMLSGRNTPETMLPMSARVGGFLLGALLMWAIPLISGSPVTLY